jgi:hypothetical protein
MASQGKKAFSSGFYYIVGFRSMSGGKSQLKKAGAPTQ